MPVTGPEGPELGVIRPDLSLTDEWIVATPFGFVTASHQVKIEFCTPVEERGKTDRR